MKEIINKIFWQSLNPMALTDGPKGTFLEVNEAFLKRFGLKRKEIIGNTVVKSGLVTYKESLVFRKEVKEKGCARNILMQLRTHDNRIHFVIINTIKISTKGKTFWLTTGTDAPPLNRATKEQQNDILKIFDFYDGAGVLILNILEKKNYSLFYANQEAKLFLRKFPLEKIMYALQDKEIAYLIVGKESYAVKRAGEIDNSLLQLIIINKYPPDINYEHIFEALKLTPRQQQVTLLAASGYSNADIAKKLFISEYTVKDHLKEIFRLMNISNRSELFPKLLNLK